LGEGTDVDLGREGFAYYPWGEKTKSPTC